MARRDVPAGRRLDADRLAMLDDHTRDVGLELHHAAVCFDEATERLDDAARAAHDEWNSRRLEGEHDDPRHERRQRIVGTHAGVEDPRREEGPDEIRAELPLEPRALGLHGFADERPDLAWAATEELPEERLASRPAPRLLAECGEDERCLPLDVDHGGAIGVAVACR